MALKHTAMGAKAVMKRDSLSALEYSAHQHRSGGRKIAAELLVNGDGEIGNGAERLAY